MRKVAIGSKNPTKERAARDILEPIGLEVVSVDANPGVSKQPLSERETRSGAERRAHEALSRSHADIGIGLEGGVCLSDGKPYLCHWGVLVSKDGAVFVTSGPVIRLPDSFWDTLSQGTELGTIMHEHVGIENLGSKEGAIGVFTDGLVTRYQMFDQLLRVLWGQYCYHEKTLNCPQ